jgi:hypothetical protein
VGSDWPDHAYPDNRLNLSLTKPASAFKASQSAAHSSVISWSFPSGQFETNPIMTTRTRDTIALFAIATGAILAVLYADADLGQIFTGLAARF